MGADGLRGPEFIRADSGFCQLRQTLHQPFLRVLLTNDPGLVQVITDHIDESEPMTVCSNEDEGLPPEDENITATEEEAEALDRQAHHVLHSSSPTNFEIQLRRLQSKDGLVVEVYFMCEKNENLAADLLCGLSDLGDKA